MKYILIDETKTDIFTKEFDTELGALAAAKYEWEHLTESEKKDRVAFYVLKSVNPDEEAENHFDGDVVKDYKSH